MRAVIDTCIACAVLALLVAACSPGPTNGRPTPIGDVSVTVTVVVDGRATFGAADFTSTGSGSDLFECTFDCEQDQDVTAAFSLLTPP